MLVAPPEIQVTGYTSLGKMMMVDEMVGEMR